MIMCRIIYIGWCGMLWLMLHPGCSYLSYIDFFCLFFFLPARSVCYFCVDVNLCMGLLKLLSKCVVR